MMKSPVTISWPTLLLGVLLTFSVRTESQSTLSNYNPLKNGFYRTEIIYPDGQHQGSLTLRNYPVTISGGYHINHAATLPRVRLQPVLTGYLVRTGNTWKPSAGLPSWRSPPSAASLFTPATVKQPAETLGQIMEYNKALRQEAEEARKNENKLTTVGLEQEDEYPDNPNSLAITTYEPTSYVDVSIDGDEATSYKYKYTI